MDTEMMMKELNERAAEIGKKCKIKEIVEFDDCIMVTFMNDNSELCHGIMFNKDGTVRKIYDVK